MTEELKTSDFDFDLPQSQIAQHPAHRRDESRMMVLNRSSGTTTHRTIRDLPDFLNPGDVLVLNNTRVIPARTHGVKETGGNVEVLFVEPAENTDNQWWVMMKSSHRPRPGSHVSLPGNLDLEILENRADGLNRVAASGPDSVMATLQAHGETPLPPYIRREGPERGDEDRYQTVYAKHPGSVAAPTAGLHFTEGLLDTLRKQGVRIAELTLHVGPGTFRPVKTDRVADHVMDEERYDVSAESAAALNLARERGGRIVAVGSTSVRTLETIVGPDGHFKPGTGRSGLFIHPPYTFQAVDAILTNFHLPKSTLLMMMSAFTRREHMLKAYREAVQAGYRFFSYGDCMLLQEDPC